LVPDTPQSESDPLPATGHAGIRATLRVRLLDRFGIRLPRQGENTPRSRQATGDDRTLWKIICVMVTAPDKPAAQEQALRLVNLANECLTRLPVKRLPAFVALAKERYPAVAALWPPRTQNASDGPSPNITGPAAHPGDSTTLRQPAPSDTSCAGAGQLRTVGPMVVDRSNA